MRINREKSLEIIGLDGNLRARYSNRGEPFREGLEIQIEDDEYGSCVAALLSERDVAVLLRFLQDALENDSGLPRGG